MAALKIASYNCKIFKGELKKNMCGELLEKCDFLLIQEHWLYEENFNRFDSIYDNVNISIEGKSAMDPSIIRIGRPHGGCAILWKSDISYNIFPIKTISNKLNCINVKIDNDVNFLLFNVYMPTDTRHIGNSQGNDHTNYGNSNFHEYQDILAEISIISRTIESSFIMIGGDFNTDLEKINLQTNQLIQFCDSESFIISDLLPLSNVKYTFECQSSGNKSFIDHILVTPNIQSYIKSCVAYDSINNSSDHISVILELNINCSYLKTNQIVNQPGIAWYESTIDNLNDYKKMLDLELSKIAIPLNALNCQKIDCKEHSDDIDKFHNDILSSCISAGQKVLPRTSKYNSNKRKTKAGWDEYVKEKQVTAMSWHKQWKDEGCPKNTYTAIMRRKTRLQYHYAIKCIEKNENIIKSNNMAKKFLEKPKKAWNDCAKLRGRKNRIPNSVENVTGEKNISELFGREFSGLFNSVGNDLNNINGLKSLIEESIVASNASYNIKMEELTESLKSLLSGKNDGYIGIYSDHIIHGTEMLNSFILRLFNSM